MFWPNTELKRHVRIYTYQSRTHVDTAQAVLEDLTDLRHIDRSQTIKIFGSHVTFKKKFCQSDILKQRLLPDEGVKPHLMLQ